MNTIKIIDLKFYRNWERLNFLAKQRTYETDG